MLKEVIQVKESGGKNSRQIIQWTNISFNVAKSFMRYVYGGFFDLELETADEWSQAKYLGDKFDFESWNNYIETLKDEYNQILIL